MEGGRELREAKLAELRRQLDEQEKAATPFKPTNFSKKDRYPEVMPRLSRQNPGQHLVTYAQKKLALEERRMQVSAKFLQLRKGFEWPQMLHDFLMQTLSALGSLPE
eukprot:scaffold282526_cov21-Tisochrysis_lutea.AAC.1